MLRYGVGWWARLLSLTFTCTIRARMRMRANLQLDRVRQHTPSSSPGLVGLFHEYSLRSGDVPVGGRAAETGGGGGRDTEVGRNERREKRPVNSSLIWILLKGLPSFSSASLTIVSLGGGSQARHRRRGGWYVQDDRSCPHGLSKHRPIRKLWPSTTTPSNRTHKKCDALSCCCEAILMGILMGI